MFKKAFVLYGCQLYKAALPLSFTPLFLNALGAERYGMIAFFYMLVGLLGLLDVGISGTFLKLVATNKEVLVNYKKVISLFNKILLLFIFIATSLSLLFLFGNEYIVTTWLNTSIERAEATYSIKAIGFILAALYIKSYLSSFLNGMEKQEWIAIWSVCYSSLFYFLSYFSLKTIGDNLFVFFDVMLAISILDIMMISGFVFFANFKHNLTLKKIELETSDLPQRGKEELNFNHVIRFSLQLSGLSLIWVMATQVDKLVLSAFIPLEQYAKYQIAVQVCTVITIFSAPLTQMLLPRLSALYANNQLQKYAELYCSAILIFIVILAPIMPYFFVFGDDLIALWMKDLVLGQSINMYAKWLVSAAFLAVTMNFVFICLYTLGQLKRHFYAYALYSSFTIPLSILVAKNYGAIGSAKFVFTHTIIFMLVWGGLQIKIKFPKLIFPLFVFFVSIVLFSMFSFNVLLQTMDLNLPLLFRVLFPPVANAGFIFLFLFMFRCKVNEFINSVELFVSHERGEYK